MPCLIALLALVFPRIAIILVAIFSQYLHQAYETVIWPVLGFFFLPLTTLAYAWAWHAGDGEVSGGHLVVVIIAVLVDLGIIGGSSSKAKHKKIKFTGR
jgi:hypothetical protein